MENAFGATVSAAQNQNLNAAGQLWTEDEIAELFRIERITVIRKLATDPQSLPPSLKIGRRHVWVPTEVLAWVARKTAEQHAKSSNTPKNYVSAPQLPVGMKRGRGRPRKVAPSSHLAGA